MPDYYQRISKLFVEKEKNVGYQNIIRTYTDKDPGLDINNYRFITHVMLRGLIRPINKPLETTTSTVYN